MGRYLVRFTYLTTLQITEPARFSYGSTEVFVNNDTSYDHSSAWPNQLAVCVETDAETMEAAITNAENHAEITIQFLIISTSASTDHCRFDRAIDYDSGIKDRLFLQEYSVPFLNPSTRELSPEKLTKFIEAISNQENILLYENIECINRSMRWYRKGLLEDDLLDQHQYYWIALEILEPLLNQKYNVPKKKIEYKCNGCKLTTSKLVPSHDGIKNLVIELGYDELKADEIRQLRNKIVHGSKSLDGLALKAEVLLPILERTVLLGLLKILNFSEENEQDFLREPYLAPRYPMLTIETIFADMPKSLLSQDSIPIYSYTPVTTDMTTHKESKGTGTLRFYFPHPCSVKSNRNIINYHQDPEAPQKFECEILVNQERESEGIDRTQNISDQ